MVEKKVVDAKTVAATGIASVAVTGFAIRLSASDAREWLQVLNDFYPVIAILAVAVAIGWIVKAMHDQHKECQEELRRMRTTIYPLLTANTRSTDNMPTVQDFADGNYSDTEIYRTLERRKQTPNPLKRAAKRRSSDRTSPDRRGS